MARNTLGIALSRRVGMKGEGLNVLYNHQDVFHMLSLFLRGRKFASPLNSPEFCFSPVVNGTTLTVGSSD